MQKHPALSFEDLGGQLDDEAIGLQEIAKDFDAEKILELHAGFGVLAEDGVGRGGGTGDARAAMLVRTKTRVEK